MIEAYHNYFHVINLFYHSAQQSKCICFAFSACFYNRTHIKRALQLLRPGKCLKLLFQEVCIDTHIVPPHLHKRKKNHNQLNNISWSLTVSLNIGNILIESTKIKRQCNIVLNHGNKILSSCWIPMNNIHPQETEEVCSVLWLTCYYWI